MLIKSVQECRSCPTGQYSSMQGATSSSVCSVCAAGTYSDVPGLSGCVTCPAGAFSLVAGANSSSACRVCASGSNSSSSRQVSLNTFAKLKGTHAVDLRSLDGIAVSSSTQAGSSPLGKEERTKALSCSLEQIFILELMESAALGSRKMVEKFFLMLMQKTNTSSPEAAVQFILQTNFIFDSKDHKANRGQASRMKSSESNMSTKRKLQSTLGTTRGQQQPVSRAASAELETNSLSESALLGNLCGEGNTALFGQCIASDFQYLQTLGSLGPVYSGVLFSFAVMKKDAYNNTMISDDYSLVRAMPLLATRGADSSTSILGSALSQMSSGVAAFSFAVKATFNSIKYANRSAVIYPNI